MCFYFIIDIKNQDLPGRILKFASAAEEDEESEMYEPPLNTSNNSSEIAAEDDLEKDGANAEEQKIPIKEDPRGASVEEEKAAVKVDQEKKSTKSDEQKIDDTADTVCRFISVAQSQSTIGQYFTRKWRNSSLLYF